MAENDDKQITPKVERLTTPKDRESSAIVEAKFAMFSGPLPHPEILAAYNDAVPDGADRILRMAEEQAEHRQYLEKMVIVADTRRSRLGLILGFVFVMALVAAGTFLIYVGKDTTGLVILLGSGASLAGLFIYQVRERERQLREHSRTAGELTREQQLEEGRRQQKQQGGSKSKRRK